MANSVNSVDSSSTVNPQKFDFQIQTLIGQGQTDQPVIAIEETEGVRDGFSFDLEYVNIGAEQGGSGGPGKERKDGSSGPPELISESKMAKGSLVNEGELGDNSIDGDRAMPMFVVESNRRTDKEIDSGRISERINKEVPNEVLREVGGDGDEVRDRNRGINLVVGVANSTSEEIQDTEQLMRGRRRRIGGSLFYNSKHLWHPVIKKKTTKRQLKQINRSKAVTESSSIDSSDIENCNRLIRAKSKDDSHGKKKVENIKRNKRRKEIQDEANRTWEVGKLVGLDAEENDVEVVEELMHMIDREEEWENNQT